MATYHSLVTVRDNATRCGSSRMYSIYLQLLNMLTSVNTHGYHIIRSVDP